MKKGIWLAAVIAIIVLSLFTGCSMPKISLFGGEPQPLREYTLAGEGQGKVLLLSIDGTISGIPQKRLLHSQPSMVQQVAAYLKHAQTDPEIKALLLKVNSPGGTVTASDIIYHEIVEYKKKTGVKIVVAMMNLAASGAYYISLPADHIVAHPTTITGSIGVIFMHPQVNGLMDKVGFSMEVNKSGKNKDMGSPFRESTDEEVALFQELTDGLADRFYSLLDQHRSLNATQREEIKTARVFLPEKAKALGLVDEIGYLDDAIAKAKEIAGLGPDARVVAYRRNKIEDDTIYNPAVEHNGGDLNAMMPALAPFSMAAEPGFYYIWPAAIGR